VNAHEILDEYIVASNDLAKLDKVENDLAQQLSMAKRTREEQEIKVRNLWSALAKEIDDAG
jgi:hypothetical protein